MTEETKTAESAKTQIPTTPQVQWDDSDMRMSYANVVNAASTREEVTLFFGTNQTWNAGGDEYKVKLTDRIVLNPFAAKRLAVILTGVLQEYEKRYGTLAIESRDQASGNPGRT